MPEKIRLSINEPCHEQWGDMQPNEEGRFCGSCQKTVVDFSMMSDEEVLSWLSGAGRSVCGRFMEGQLNRELKPARLSGRRRWALWWQLLLAGWLVSSEAKAQTGGITGPRIDRIDPARVNSELAGKGPIIGDVVGGLSIRRIPELKGELRVQIVDAVSDEAIGWASVRWAERAVQRMADSAGWISLTHKEVRRARRMEISAIGYATTLFDISDVSKDEYVRVLRLPRAADELPAATVRGYGMTRCGSVMGSVSIVKGAVSVGQRVEGSSLLKDTLVSLGLVKQPLRVYPNPVVRGAAVTLSLKQSVSGNYLVQLFSAAGTLVESMRIEGVNGPRTELLNIPGTVAAGLYFVSVQHEQTGKVYTQKVVVL